MNNAAAQCHWSYRTLCCFCRKSGEFTVETTKGRGDQIDRNSSGDCKYLKSHGICGCGASCGIFINIVVFVVGLGLCLSNRQTLLFLLSHFRSLIITIVIYIVFPSGSASKFLINISQFPQTVFFHTIYNPLNNLLSTHNSHITFPSVPLPNLPNTICFQHSIPPLPSLPSLYPIPLTQSAFNTQFPHSLPFPTTIQSP